MFTTNLLLKKLIIIFGLTLSFTALADIEIKNDQLFLSGTIKKSDFEELKKELLKHPPLIELNSIGGDVVAAINIGTLLRKYNTTALINNTDVCISACVLVLAGSTFRMIKGKVGIHRPYFPNDKATTENEQKVAYASIKKLIVNYLNQVNVKLSLYDDMFRISPRNVKFLNNDELLFYGLSGTDPYFEEAASAQEAADLQISKEELFQRKNNQDECIKYFDISKEEMVSCRMASIYGITKDEFIKRRDIAKSKCSQSEDEKFKAKDCEEKILRGF